MSAAIEALVAEGRLARDVPLAPLMTYRMGGPARWYAEPQSEAEVVALARALGGETVPVLVLGRGSNLVVSDAGFAGVVIRPGGSLAEWSIGPAGEVSAGGAVPTPLLARRCASAGRGGLEFYVGIPGSVGGAVRGNAGCHGTDTAEWLEAARVVDTTTAAITERTPAELDMGYRRSNLGPTDVVVGARYRTVASDPAEAEARVREIIAWRKAHQPGGSLNAGSVFKNPPGDAAGRLIDAAGLKGLRVGGASVSERHANFFVAEPGATAQDVFDLVAEVRRRVFDHSGVALETEVQFVGEFREAAA
jgi:UDP-N-acetylmuramate dehydrogenase